MVLVAASGVVDGIVEAFVIVAVGTFVFELVGSLLFPLLAYH